jgi:hypothetical protein
MTDVTGAAPSPPPAGSAGAQPGVRADPTPSPLTDADYDGSDGGSPGKPDEYALTLPETFKPVLPDGARVELDAQDPRLPMARATARELDLSQKQFSRLLQLDVELQMNEAKRFNDAVAAEERKLGASFPQRKAAVLAELNRRFTPDQVRAVSAFTMSATTFEMLEVLLGRASSSSSASSSSDNWAQKMWPRGFDPNPQRAR